MERAHGTFPVKKARTTQPVTSVAAVQVGLPHIPASSYRSKRCVERSYSRSPSTSRSPTPATQRPITSRAETSSPHSMDSRLLDRVWNELSCAQLPTASKHAETLPPIDLSSLHAPSQFHPYTRPPTVLELISAIAKGQNVNRRFECEIDNDTQAFSVPRSYRQSLHVAQLLTLSLNPDRVFNPTHLGQHDYVLVDSFLHNDFFQQVRSIFTKEIYVPTPSDVTGIQSQHLPVLVVARALTALASLSEQVTTYLRELTTQGRPTPDVMLARLWTLHRYADNILQRRSMIYTQLLPFVFSQPSEIQTMINLLASYGVTYSKIVTAVATSAATHAEVVRTYDLYHKLLTEHFQSQSGLSALSVQVSDFLPPAFSAFAASHTQPLATPTSSSMDTTPIPGPSQTPKVKESQVPQPMVLSTPPAEESPASPTSSIIEIPIQRSQEVRAAKASLPQPQAKAQPAAGPEDGPPKPIPLEQRPVVVSPQPQQQQPQQPSTSEPTVMCYFCGGRHWSSSCSVVFRLSDRMKMIVNRGGCFLCCRRHAEKDCPVRETKRCRACKSKLHDTSFCYLNNGVENDVDALDYSGFLEQCKAMADMVRKGESTGFY